MVMKRCNFALIAALAALPLPWVAHAAENSGHKDHAMPDSAPATAHAGKGVVKWVDAASGEIDLRHEPIPSLKWPAMTMTFKARNPELLKGLKEGDRVDFDIMKTGNEYEIVRIQPAK
jgi:Cu/Ag efflux protein CusF